MLARARALGQLSEALRQSDSAASGATLPSAVLRAALEASVQHTQYWIYLLVHPDLKSSFRRVWGKAELQHIQQRLTDRLSVVEEVSFLADVYARRAEQKHPGWEGIRIVRERKPAPNES